MASALDPHAVAIHTERILAAIRAAPSADVAIKHGTDWATWAAANGVAPAIRSHVRDAVGETVARLKAIAKADQISIAKQAGKVAARMTGERDD